MSLRIKVEKLMVKKTCSQCGGVFETDNLNKTSCSIHCNSRRYRDKVRKILINTDCQNCGKNFLQTIYKQKFCSRSCGLNYRGRTVYGSVFVNKYRSGTPEVFMKNLLGYYKRRKTLCMKDLIGLWKTQCGKCAITGREMTYIAGKGRVTTNISIDRIDSTIGYAPDNIQLVCMDINIMKSTLTMSELYSLCRSVLAHAPSVPT